ncbi:MAG TPA: nucleotide sugar dehydrogenase [Candidatus Methylomirabilis sp.]|nr:nucleotide sugar dehydrogenase [Candidatus Methylomirabilis sp.]
MPHREFTRRVETKQATVAVIGLGYVGLPIAVAFAESGLTTVALDIDHEKVDQLRRGVSYIPDVSSDAVATQVQEGRLLPGTDEAVLDGMDAAVICVPTPFTKAKSPDLTAVVASAEMVARHLRPGQLVVLQSTTYPGTTEEVVRPILERTGLQVGHDFFLAFSPERIDPGNRRYGVTNTPKVVGGCTPACTRVCAALFEALIAADQIHQVHGPRAAEMCKLLENTFRSVNIALVNELLKLGDRMGIDLWEVIDAAATKPFGFMPFYPGPGVGGHCIPVDPYYLAWKAREYDFHTKFIELAAETNASMPFYTVRKVTEALNRGGRAVKAAKILILGVAFKRDVDDPRNSPALEVLKMLAGQGAEVTYHDPYIPKVALSEDRFLKGASTATVESVPLTAARLEAQDCVLIAVAHRCFEFPWIVRHSRLVVDAQNATKMIQEGREKIVKL